MDKLKLYRLEKTPLMTFGVLLVNDMLLCYTLELPYRDNKKDISCIPTGSYNFSVYNSKKFWRKCIGLYDVPGRDYISIHVGNDITDTNGCILVGQIKTPTYLSGSIKALHELISSCKEGKGTIEIVEMRNDRNSLPKN